MKMSCRYKFSSEEIAAIREARKQNKDKRVESRLKALEMSAQGKNARETGEACGFHPIYITQLIAKYRDGGLEAIAGKHYGGNHRNMSVEEEAAILEPFLKTAEEGKIVTIGEIKAAYQAAVGHSIGNAQIYYVLRRHGWRKVMPRSEHPKKANEEAIEASKKLNPKSQFWQPK